MLPDASAAAPLARDFGGEDIQQYESMVLAYGRSDSIAGIRASARKANYELIERDDFDTLQLPGGTIDTRKGTEGSLPGRALMPFPAEDVAVTWLIQFVGPPMKSWKESVTATGVTLVQYIPYAGMIVVGTNAQLRAVRDLPFIQFVDLFHPFLKSVTVPRSQPKGVDVLIILPDGAFIKPLVSRIRSMSDVMLEPRVVGTYLQIPAHVSDKVIEALIAEPLLIALTDLPRLDFSDERVATSLTSNIDVVTGVPLQPKGYKRWLGDACQFCGALRAEGFWVGVADSGIDGGLSTGGVPNPHHTGEGLHRADLPEAGKIRFGSNFSNYELTPNPGEIGYLYDYYYHGTMVAGIIAADPPTGAASDAGGFYWGSGIAPSTGIFATKMIKNDNVWGNSQQPYGGIFEEASDATTNGVFIQNHSQNQYRFDASDSGGCKPVYDGQYSVVSQKFDAAVIDSDGNANNGLTPITLTVSAGNQDQQKVSASCLANTLLSIPPATAKNVIAVGGAENVRGLSEQWACMGTRADSFSNIASNSMHGTKVIGRFKPDLMAPSSEVVSLKSNSTALAAGQVCFDGSVLPPILTDYLASNGTSWAAPVAAGASILAARVFAESISPGCGPLQARSPGAASPALIKGMLVASARSMRNGEDRALAAPWAPKHNYRAGTIVRPTVANGRYYSQTTADTGFVHNSGGTEPLTWPTTAGDTVTDGPDVTWREMTWQGSHTYSTGDPVRPTTSNGHLYRVVVGGTTGAEPAWPSGSGVTFSEGGITWQEIGTTTIGPLPNSAQGFGRISLIDLLSPYPHKVYENYGGPISGGETYIYHYRVHDGALPVTIVLTWSDPPAQIGSDPTIGLSTNPLVNDLNLSVELGSPCSSRYIGNLTTVVSESHGEESQSYGCTEAVPFDTVNNVEFVRFRAAADTIFTFKVSNVCGDGSQKFALVLQNAYLASSTSPPPATPTGFSATATSTTAVSLTWQAVSGATSYEVQRKSAGESFGVPIVTTSASYSDPGLAADTTYVYRVRAKNFTAVSDYTLPDLATTIMFADDPLIAQQTVVRKVHLDQLRTAANALRTAAGLPLYSFTDPTITAGVTKVKAAHLNELRTAIEPAQDLLHIPRISYSHPSPAANSTVISAVDFQELRNGLK